MINTKFAFLYHILVAFGVSWSWIPSFCSETICSYFFTTFLFDIILPLVVSSHAICNVSILKNGMGSDFRDKFSSKFYVVAWHSVVWKKKALEHVQLVLSKHESPTTWSVDDTCETPTQQPPTTKPTHIYTFKTRQNWPIGFNLIRTLCWSHLKQTSHRRRLISTPSPPSNLAYLNISQQRGSTNWALPSLLIIGYRTVDTKRGMPTRLIRRALLPL